MTLEFIDTVTKQKGMECKDILFVVCHPTCLRCDPYTFQCLQCKTWYSLKNNLYTYECVLTQELKDNGYNCDTTFNLCTKCYAKCNQCVDEGDATNNNCYFCLDTNDYYYHIINNKGRNFDTQCPSNYPYYSEKECFDKCPEDKPYLDGNECKKAKRFAITILIINEETNECVTNCKDATTHGFLLVDLSGKKKCVKECPSDKVNLIKEDNYCVDQCPITLIEYTIDNKRYCKLDNCEHFEYNSNSYQCGTCNDLIIQELNQCVTTCPSPFIYISGKVCQSSCEPLKTDNNNICKSTCQSGQFEIVSSHECVNQCPSDDYIINDANRGIKICVDNCKDTQYPFYIENTKNCIKQCESPTQYISVDKNQCISSCPLFTIVISNECIFDTDTFKNGTFNQSLEYLEENIQLIQNQTIKGKDFIAEIYTSANPPSKKENLSSIDMSNCEIILRREYKIPNEDPLIIAKYDKINTSALFNQVEYEVFTKEGNKLDLSVCNSVYINITYPINFNSSLEVDLIKAEEMLNDGIDIFNSNSAFFTDICYYYPKEINNIILSDRRNNIYNNVSLCEENCIYKSINYTSKRISCDCFSKNNVNTSIYENKEVLNNNIAYDTDIISL